MRVMLRTEVNASILNRCYVEGKVVIRIFQMRDMKRRDEKIRNRVIVLIIYCYLSQISSDIRVTWLEVVTPRVVPQHTMRVLYYYFEFAWFRILFLEG